MKPIIIKALISIASRSALICFFCGIVVAPIALGISGSLSGTLGTKQNNVQAEESAREFPYSISEVIRAVAVFPLGGVLIGAVYTFLLARYWSRGQRIRTGVDEFVGRSMTIAEKRSTLPLVLFSSICWIGMFYLVFQVIMYVGNPGSWIVFGIVAGIASGFVLQALTTGLVDAAAAYEIKVLKFF